MTQRWGAVACVALVVACSRTQNAPGPDAGIDARADAAKTSADAVTDAGPDAEVSVQPEPTLAPPDPMAAACAAFAAGRVKDRRLLETKAYLCDGDSNTSCAKRTQANCTELPTCMELMGSSMCAPNGGPCTADVVYKGCGPAPRELLARQVVAHVDCTAHGGTWESRGGGDAWAGGPVRLGHCTCPKDTKFVAEKGCR